MIGSVNAVLYLYTPEIYPTRMRAIGTGAATCWLRLASAAGPVLVGYLGAQSGTAAVFLMFAAAGLIGTLTATAMLETQTAGRDRRVIPDARTTDVHAEPQLPRYQQDLA